MDFEKLNQMLVDWTGEIDGFMYTYILVILLVFVGIYFTIRTKGVQIRYIKDMFTQLTEKKHVEGEKSISSFQALMVSTASRVVHAGPDLQDPRQGGRVPGRSGLLHPAGPGPALARHHLRLGAHFVLRLRLQRPAGLQHDLGP